jgi:hypothetical protein
MFKPRIKHFLTLKHGVKYTNAVGTQSINVTKKCIPLGEIFIRTLNMTFNFLKKMM